ncbi:FAD dependent oxidoreductase, partial [Neoconidiobolus thromboides FSU 785]
ITIIGGGIIGLTTAYYLIKKAPQTSITIIERTSIASCASGKAGGFLALDWNDHSALGKLTRKSFELHQQLADELNGEKKFGYRRVVTFQLEAEEKEDIRNQKNLPDDLTWLNEKFDLKIIKLGDKNTCAQINPHEYCETIKEYIKERGVKIIYDEVNGITEEKDGKLSLKLVNNSDFITDKVVLSMGPWTSSLTPSLKKIHQSLKFKISGSRAHSVIFEPKQENFEKAKVLEHVLFTNITIKNQINEIEIYPRSNKQVYICGLGDNVCLPEHSNSIIPDDKAINKLIELGIKLIPELKDYNVIKKQVCYLPYSNTGLPILGPLTNNPSILIASGHSCWGILNAPITGDIMSNLLLEKKTEDINLTPFLP